MTTTLALLTAEEFSQLPNLVDGTQEELVRGEIITMPQPGFLHGFVQVNIAMMLKNFVKNHRLGWVITESGVITERDPDTVRGPDVSYFSYERLPEMPKVYPSIGPDLVVEILSASYRPTATEEKIAEYLAAGTLIVWVINPEEKTVTVYTPTNTQELDATATLSGGEVLPGFACMVAELFAE